MSFTAQHHHGLQVQDQALIRQIPKMAYILPVGILRPQDPPRKSFISLAGFKFSLMASSCDKSKLVRRRYRVGFADVRFCSTRNKSRLICH